MINRISTFGNPIIQLYPSSKRANQNIQKPVENTIKTNSFVSPLNYQANFAVKPLSFLGETANSINKVISISENGEAELIKRADGGFLVDNDTETIIYYGNAAKNFLEQTDYFDQETEVISQSGCNLNITAYENSDSFTLSEPGAVLINKGTSAKIKPRNGNFMVLTTEKKPDWYEKSGPKGIHKDHFNEIAHINRHMFKKHLKKTVFSEDELQKLLTANIIKEVDDNYIKFSKFHSKKTLKNKLSEIQMTEEEIEAISNIWNETKVRKLYLNNNSKIKKDELSSNITNKLIKANLLHENSKDNEFLYWKPCCNENKMVKHLNKTDLSGEEKANILKLWSKSTKAGFDNLGKAWIADGIAVYLQKDKINLWNKEKTEWIVHSDASSANSPFVCGVSRVNPLKIYKEPTNFNEIRPKEVLHRHPNREEKKQTETYLITQGKAALLTIQNGKPNVSVLKSGDMAIIKPGVTHRLLEIKGEYEHLVCQIPSAFQYGFMFKEEKSYEDYSLKEEDVLKMAVEKLNESEKQQITNENIGYLAYTTQTA